MPEFKARPGQLTAMISSTARDLPEHRKEVLDACLRQSVFPVMMEHLPASDAEAIGISLQMVDEADIYLGVFAHRYGYVPAGHQISVTEMEYNRAVERGIPRLIFLMGKDHPLKIEDVEVAAAAELNAFKNRVGTENIVNFFNSPADLRAHAINSLSQLRTPDLHTFHYVSDIPAPPEPFIAHPYTLLQTHRLVGRQPELNLLTDWAAKPSAAVYAARVLNFVALGGMGKSALTWKWFNEIAPQEMKPLAGRMWWSFYESDATFENFVTRALAYVTRRPLAEVERIPAPDREAQLLAALDREPFLLVLDGLERLLIAYARMDAAHLDALGTPAPSRAGVAADVTDAPGPSSGENVSQATPAREGAGVPRLRKTADPRAGAFLRKLATVRAARVLVSTRLYPADLENRVNGDPLPGCFKFDLPGLAEDDALELWRAFGATGARDRLLPVFRSVENHPLLIQSLAGAVARHRRAPGDFEAWRQAQPDFNPFRDLPLVQVKSHVLECALRGLAERAQQVLQTIAAFRMPASYDTLLALLSGAGKPCASEPELDAVLAELEERGLVGWDKRANRYDLHPIVRGVVWNGLNEYAQRGVYINLHAHFEAVPKIHDWLRINRLEDLTPTIELYNTLIGLRRYEDAGNLFYNRLSKPALYRLNATRQLIQLIELLFPDGLNLLPRLSDPAFQSVIINALALGYEFSGQPKQAASFFRRYTAMSSARMDDYELSIGLGNLANVLRLSGILREAETAARRAVLITRTQKNHLQETASLQFLGLILAVRGLMQESAIAFQRALQMLVARSATQNEGVVNSFLAQRALFFGEFSEARSFANRSWELAYVMNLEADFIRAARVQGEAALGLGDFAVADERLHHALTRARQVNHAEEELPALIALAELRRREGKLDEARELLADVWESAERGPYPVCHADACNVLAAIERDAGQRDAAIAAATSGYRLAWCDGPPYAYHWGLTAARRHLQELGAPEPQLPPFDPTQHEPLPEVEINPHDEFYVEVEEDGAGD